VGGSVVDGGGGNNMVDSSVVDLGNSGVVDLGDSSLVGDHRLGNNRLHNRLDQRGVNSREDLGHGVVGGDRGNVAVGSDSRDVAVGVHKKGVSLSLSLPLYNVLDRSILGNVLGAISTGGDSSVLCRVVVVGDGVGGNLRLSIDHRGSNTLDNRGGKRGGNIAIGGGERLDSSSVIELVEGRVDLGHSSNMAVGADSRDVAVCVHKEGVSLSLSLPLDNVLDRSVLGNVLGANSSVGDSGVVLRVVVVGDGVGGNLGLSIDHRGNMLDHGGGNTLDNRGGKRLDHRGGNMIIGGGNGLDSSSVVGVGVEGPEERGGGVHQSIGFRLSTGNSGQSENYKHLHDEELLF